MSDVRRGVGTGGNPEAALWPSGNKRNPNLLDLDAPEALAELAAALVKWDMATASDPQYNAVEDAKSLLAAPAEGAGAGVTPHFADEQVSVYLGDCVTVMAGMEPESVDAIVTDPPYGLEFMGKEWDRFGTDQRQPGDPTFHKSGAGPFDRATVRHGVYGGKTLAAVTAFQSWCTAWGREALRVTRPGGYLLAFGGTRTHHRLVCGLEDAGWIIRDELDWIYASGFPKGKANLKPAHEPIVLARKPGPLQPLGIDAGRIGVDGGHEGAGPGPSLGILGDGLNGERAQPVPGLGRWPSNVLLSDPELFDQPNPEVVGSGAVSTDNGLARRDLIQPNATDGDRVALGNGAHTAFHYGDTGGYSRFFILPKADRADREPVLREYAPRADVAGVGALRDGGRPSIPRFNQHPTVKPVDLMRHLVRLVTPPGGTVLDPFLGSGSTLIAAIEEGFTGIGIEQAAEYLQIAEARLNGRQIGMAL